MKILLQHTASRLFYKSAGAWVEEESEARPFNSALEAIEYCEKQGLSGLALARFPFPRRHDAASPPPLRRKQECPIMSSSRISLMVEQAIILLADDNPGDVALTQRALQAAHLPNPLQIVAKGQEVIEYLRGAIHARHSGARIPLLILMDLRLPDLTGFEVLEWIRTQEGLANVLVVIYTASEKASDANRAMHLGANSYWVKPASFQGLVSLMLLLKAKIDAIELTPQRAMLLSSASRAPVLDQFNPSPRPNLTLANQSLALKNSFR